MPTAVYDKRNGDAESESRLAEADETGRWSRGRAMIVLAAVSLGIWAMIGVVVAGLIG